ncbi:hydrogenase maturation protease [Nocardia fusca]|uniref:hydrogenase maturation protease n=1 Tax=Nocardia fusca TaxID=941183 RepID=UPI000A03CE61|nr:hydrogenase maturation protease [Nocardia fusca]
MTRSRVVVIGMGTGLRCDDGIGPVVASLIAEWRIPWVSAEVSEGEPTRLMDLWTGADLAVVVDAVVCEPASPGRVLRIDTARLRRAPAAAGSHCLGLAETVALGDALGRRPGRLVIFGVEAACLDTGVGLSPPVVSAIPAVIQAVLADIARCVPLRDTAGRFRDPSFFIARIPHSSGCSVGSPA